ncbi:MAG: DUF1559 domain-containing protein [Planctomycetes bacterium]|nr:DUF1559 domain-containing protein [Planctomycetota bacterium]
MISGSSGCEQCLGLTNGLVPAHDLPTSSITVSNYGSWHPGGVHFLMVDGSVRFVSLNVSYNAIKARSTKSAKDTVSEF